MQILDVVEVDVEVAYLIWRRGYLVADCPLGVGDPKAHNGYASATAGQRLEESVDTTAGLLRYPTGPYVFVRAGARVDRGAHRLMQLLLGGRVRGRRVLAEFARGGQRLSQHLILRHHRVDPSTG